jgi:hypothetical protein
LRDRRGLTQAHLQLAAWDRDLSPFLHHIEPIMTFALDLPGFAGFESRDILQRPGPIPQPRIEALASPTILEHASSETATSIAAAGAKVTCGPNDNSGFCEKYVSSNTETLPIVLGVVIPLVGAFVVFLFLHRRHKKKLKKEDEDDPHKALDFGLDENPGNEKPSKKGRKAKGANIPQMSANDAVASVHPRLERGLSMDLDITNPYLLPPGLESSRESLHSLSRTLNTGDDKYRSINFIPNDGSQSYPSSLRSPVGDDGSSMTASSTRRFDGNANQNLLKHAQRISGSQSRNQSGSATDREPLAPPKSNNLAAPGNGVPRDSYMSTNSSIGPTAAIRASNNYLGQFISGGMTDDKENGLVGEHNTPPRVPEKSLDKDNTANRRSMGPGYAPTQSQKEESATSHDAATLPQHEDTREPGIPSMNFSNTPPLSQDFSLPAINMDDYQSGQNHPQSNPPNQHGNNLRPESDALPNSDERRETRQPTLPVLGLPHLAEHEQQQPVAPEQPEEEDYYDDYYDYEEEIGYDPHRLTAMGERPLPPDDPSEDPEQRANRIRSFYKEYFDDSSKPTRMPSKPSRQDYYDGSENYAYDGYDVNHYYDDQGSYPAARNQSRGPSRQARFTGPEGRHRATFSAGSFQPGQSPRAFSSASGRYGPPGRRGPPKKTIPAPKPLMTLPTPHMMKDDSFLTHMPIDYAPPGAFKGQRAGTPDSLRGEMKPYKAQRAHIPLASSFDDLAAMPSP